MKSRLGNSWFVIISSIVAINSFANDAEINGQVSLKNSRYESLKINGNLAFENLDVKGELEVNGNKEGKNLKCRKIKSNGSFQGDGLIVEDIESNGSFIGKNVEISGSGKFNGYVEIQNGKLNQVEISSDKAIFTDSTINKILIKKIESDSLFQLDKNKKNKQVVELHGDSSVIDIEFAEEGEVHISDKSQVTGKMINCQVIRK